MYQVFSRWHATFPALLAALLATFQSGAQAQSFIPIDSRPATSRLPVQIAQLATEGELKVVPRELLGTASQGADGGALLQWLETKGAGEASEPLVVALDALAYGGLVQSRKSSMSAAQARANLLTLRDWQTRTGRPVYAFIVIPRHPDAVDRPRNLEVIRLMIRWAAEGTFEELHVAWDDALPDSPAPAEGRALAQFAAETAPNVRVYPGADEVAALLMARALSREERTLAVEYSAGAQAEQVIKYEGIPLGESVANHAEAAGFRVLEQGSAQRPNLTLYVYGGGDPRAAALRISSLLRRGPVVVADIERVNRANPALWRDLSTLRRDANLVSLAAWGTPGNNFGSALAHGKLFLDGVNYEAQQALLAREYANDLIYSTRLRDELRATVPEAEMNTPEAQAELQRLAAQYFPLHLGGLYELGGAALPWGRSFEWDFDLQPVE